MSDQQLVIPDYLREMIDGGTVQTSSSSLISQGGSVPRISLKGFKFRFIEEGEEVHVTPEPIFMVVLGVQPENAMAKTWYRDGYSSDSSEPPTCSSTDGIKPDSWVSEPQADFCAKCHLNAWGSAKSPSGKKAKACRDSKRLMVINPRNGLDSTIYILNVTVSSLSALSEYGKSLDSHRLPIEACITKIEFVSDSNFPQIKFALGGILKQDMGVQAIERAKKKEWITSLPSSPQLSGPASTAKLDAAPSNTDTSVKATEKVVTGEVMQNQKPQSDVDELLDNWTE